MLNRVCFWLDSRCGQQFRFPAVALTMGLIFGLLFAHPYPKETSRFSRWLLQASVVGLGFGMNLHEVLRAGRSGFVYTFMGIAFAMLVGMGLGTLLTFGGHRRS